MTTEATGQQILILGMHGFIGTHVARAALRRGVQVVGLSLDVDIEGAQRLHRTVGLDGVITIAADATDPDVIANAIEEYSPTSVINAVGILRSPGDRWIRGYSVNIATALATVDAIAVTEPSLRPRIVWIASQAEYGSAESPWREDTREMPTSAYGVSKLAATSVVLGSIRAEALTGTVLRLPIVFGPAQDPTLFVPAAIHSALMDVPFPMTGGEQRRRLAYVRDIADTIIDIVMCREQLPPLVNAPAFAPVMMKEIAGLISDLLPNREPAVLGAIRYRPDEQLDAWPDTSLAASLGLEVRTKLEVALRETVEWYERNDWFLARYRDE